MITVRQIERHWNAKDHARLFRELIAHRPESVLRLDTEDRRALAAAMAIIRLDEYAQSHVPLAGRLVRVLLESQESDGGWGDPMTTALCLRALLCSRGSGLAIEVGMLYLANLQQDEGAWPALPLRRLPSDAHASAFILSQLGDNATFRSAVRFDQALSWFQAHQMELDEDTRTLWSRAESRSRARPVRAPFAGLMTANVG